MTRWTKVLFVLSVVLLILSYPACHFGELKAKSEMAKYSADFVAAHEFDLIFARWVMPGIWMFFGGGFMLAVSIAMWIIGRHHSKRKTNV